MELYDVLTAEGADEAHIVRPKTTIDAAVTGNDSSELYIKVANTSDMPQHVTLSFKGLKSISAARALTLHADSQTAENTLDAPESIKPTESTLPVGIKTVTTTLPAKSFAVIIVKK